MATVQDLTPPSSFKATRIDQIVHISDLHFRNERDRDEQYNLVTSSFLEQMQRLKGTGAIIVACGDIVHHRSYLTPNCIEAVRRFFNSLCDILPTIIIPGNHDCIPENDQVVDSLSAIFKDRIPSGLYYLRDSGNYKLLNVMFTHYSRVNNQLFNVQPPAKEVGITRVALFHGPITEAWKSDGTAPRDAVECSRFEDFDLTLLGDFHTYQHPTDNPRIAYAGSMIMQNYGEAYKTHGYLLWSINHQQAEFYPLEDPCEFVVIEVRREGIKVSRRGEFTDASDFFTQVDTLHLPPNGQYRICKEDSCENIGYEIEQILTGRLPGARISSLSITDRGPKRSTSDNLGFDANDFRCKTQQAILSYFERKIHSMKEKKTPDIIPDINKLKEYLIEYFKNHEIKVEEKRSTQWTLQKLRFSNVLTYGPEQEIDFTKIDPGVIELRAPNSSGKTSLVYTIIYALFGTWPSDISGTSSNLVNHSAKSLQTYVEVKIGNDVYSIKRYASKNTQDLKRTVELYKNEEIKLLKGKATETEAEITKLLGTSKDFETTSVMKQGNVMLPWKLESAQRRKLFSSFNEIDLEDMNKAFKAKRDDLKGRLEVLTSQRRRTSIEALRQEKSHLQSQVTELRSSTKDVEKKIAGKRKGIEELQQKISQFPEEDELSIQRRMKLLAPDQELPRIEEINTTIADIHAKLASFTYIPRQDEIEAKHYTLMDTIDEEVDKVVSESTQIRNKKQMIWRKQEELEVAQKEVAVTPEPKYSGLPSKPLGEVERDEILARGISLSMDFRSCDAIEADITHKHQHLQHLSAQTTELQHLKWNPECDACVNNPFVHQAKESIKELQANEEDMERLREELTWAKDLERLRMDHNARVDRVVKRLREQRNHVEKLAKEVDQMKGNLYEIIDTEKKNKRRRLLYEDEHPKLLNEIKLQAELQSSLMKTCSVRDQALQQDRNKKEIERLYESLKEVEKRRVLCSDKDKCLMEINKLDAIRSVNLGQIGRLEQRIEACEESIMALTSLEEEIQWVREEYAIHDMITKESDKSGKLLINLLSDHFLPVMEKTVNRVLSNFINRKVRLSVHIKGGATQQLEIKTQFIDSRGKVSCTLGGMEEFVHALAFQLAFSSTSLRPVGSIFIIDERVSVLDKERKTHIDELFDFLRLTFKHVLLISHMEEITEFCDHHIRIMKDDRGLSRIIQNV